jgi:hypothetical protein
MLTPAPIGPDDEILEEEEILEDDEVGPSSLDFEAMHDDAC